MRQGKPQSYSSAAGRNAGPVSATTTTTSSSSSSSPAPPQQQQQQKMRGKGRGGPTGPREGESGPEMTNVSDKGNGTAPTHHDHDPSAAHGTTGTATGAGGVSAAPAVTDRYGMHMHDRLLYATMNLIGHKVQVGVVDGSVYEGIFHTATSDQGEFGVVIKLANLKTGPNGLPYGALSGDPAIIAAQQSHRTIVISPHDFISMQASGVDLAYSERQSLSDSASSSTDSLGSTGFKTDTGISGFSGKLKERDLVAWAPDEDAPLTGHSLENTGTQGKSWDQFATNQKLFGVKTTFDEELYTTKLDRDKKDFRHLEKEAERIANEITQQTSGNIHLQEERGHRVELEEEDLYGAVIREKPSTPGGATQKAYRPPQLRAGSQPASPKPEPAQQQQQPQPVNPTTSPVQPSGEKRNSVSLPPTILNSDKNQAKPVQDVIPDIARDMQQFSEIEKKKVSQKKQELRGEKQAGFKQFSDSLKIPFTPQASEQTSSSPSPAEPVQTPPSTATDPAPAAPPAAVASSASPSPSPAPATTTEKIESLPSPAAAETKSKLNPNAAAFKFNPTAKAFNPSFVPGGATPVAAAAAIAPATAPNGTKNEFLTPEKRKDITAGSPSKTFDVAVQEAASADVMTPDSSDPHRPWPVEMIPSQRFPEQPMMYSVYSPEYGYAPYGMQPAMYPPPQAPFGQQRYPMPMPYGQPYYGQPTASPIPYFKDPNTGREIHARGVMSIATVPGQGQNPYYSPPAMGRTPSMGAQTSPGPPRFNQGRSPAPQGNEGQ